MINIVNKIFPFSKELNKETYSFEKLKNDVSISMLFGAIAAIGQLNLKRLIAYSSIGHMGYALAGLAVGTNSGIQNSIIYICIYLIMNLGVFCCLFMMFPID